MDSDERSVKVLELKLFSRVLVKFRSNMRKMLEKIQCGKDRQQAQNGTKIHSRTSVTHSFCSDNMFRTQVTMPKQPLIAMLNAKIP